MSTLYGLWIDGVEVLDGGYRRARYASGGACSSSGLSFNVDAFPNPLGSTSPYAEVVAGDGPDDTENPAPWYTAERPESAEFHGFWPDTPNGLVGNDTTPIEVSVTSLGGRLGGSYLGPPRNGPRELTITLWASADTIEGLNYGLRWLANRLLLASSSSGCTRPLVAFRDTPADPENPTRGLHVLRDAGLTTGPLLVEDDEECLLRKLQFTLTAGDPCLYGPIAEVGDHHVNPVDCDTVGPIIWDCGPIESETECYSIAPPVIGAAAPVIDISNPGPHCTSDILIQMWADPSSGGCGSQGVTPDATVAIAQIPADTVVRVDCLRREVLARPTSSSVWSPGYEYLLPSGGVAPTWLTATTAPMLVTVGPANGADIAEAGFDITVSRATKEGCVF